jgi:hypothetical protein
VFAHSKGRGTSLSTCQLSAKCQRDFLISDRAKQFEPEVSELPAGSHINMKTALICLVAMVMRNKFFALNIHFWVNPGHTNKNA